MSLFSRLGNNKSSPKPTAAMLLDDFTAAVNNLVTAETAKSMAEQSEQRALDTINYAGSNPSGYATLSSTSPQLQQAIVKSSLEAHVQKAQAEKIDDFTIAEVNRMEKELKNNFIGKNIRVSIKDSGFEPIETYWWNASKGDYDVGKVRFNSVKGSIEDLSLQKNLIVLKPNLTSRLIMPSRKFLVVYVINPDTLQPAINLSLV